MNNIYWSFNILLAVFLLWSSYTYLFDKNTIEGIKDLGLPDFLRLELAFLKLIAVLIILLPIQSLTVKNWAYAGIFLFLLTALVAHLKNQDSVFIIIFLLVMIGITITTNYLMYSALK